MSMGLKREIVVPKDESHWLEMRKMDLTSTDSAVLIGASKYKTIFELYHEKSGAVPPVFKDNEPMKWGRRLESTVAHGIAEDYRLGDIYPAKDYWRIPELRVGSSFDYFIGDDGILEIKTVGRDTAQRDWILDGETSEASIHIESQIQWQLGVSGRAYCKIGALIGGNEGVLIHRDRDEKVIGKLFEKAKEFWESIEKGLPPPPDFHRDAEFISRMLGYAEPNKIWDAKGDLDLREAAVQYKQITDTIKSLEEQKDELKAKILYRIQDNEKVLGADFTISAGMVGECPVSYVRKAYRNLRINWRKK